MNIEQATGMRIRELRLSMGLSQEAFSLGVDMARSYFAEIELGKRNASMDTLARIFKGLKVTPKDFYDSPLFDDLSQ